MLLAGYQPPEPLSTCPDAPPPPEPCPPEPCPLNPALHPDPPLSQTFYLAEYAEWLISSGLNDSETVEDCLLTAADTIMEFDMGEGGAGAGEDLGWHFALRGQ